MRNNNFPLLPSNNFYLMSNSNFPLILLLTMFLATNFSIIVFMFTFTNGLVLMSIFNNNYSLVSNNNFTFNANIQSYMFIFYNLFDTYFVYFVYQQPHATISASIFVFNHVSQQLNNLFHFSFLQPFANKQPSNSFFF